jgi:hypothetical protein
MYNLYMQDSKVWWSLQNRHYRLPKSDGSSLTYPVKKCNANCAAEINVCDINLLWLFITSFKIAQKKPHTHIEAKICPSKNLSWMTEEEVGDEWLQSGTLSVSHERGGEELKVDNTIVNGTLVRTIALYHVAPSYFITTVWNFGMSSIMVWGSSWPLRFGVNIALWSPTFI